MKLIGSIALCLLALSPFAISQQNAPDTLPAGKPTPKIAFTRNWPDAKPQFFSVVAESTGQAEYRSQDKAADDQLYVLKFTMTDADRGRIFQLAEQANYFKGDFDSKENNVARTGTKSLSYVGESHNSQLTYNWSANKSIEELTSIFVGISSTIEAGRKLEYLMQHDKLGLYQQLDAMKQAAALGEFEQLQIIAPTLEQIVSDPAYMHIAQQRARELLKLSKQQ